MRVFLKSQPISSFRRFSTKGPPAPKDGINWEAFGFELTKTDYIYMAECKKGETFKEGKILPYGPIPMDPASSIFSYGQSLFEGLKAFRTHTGRAVVFRPWENCKRMNDGAKRMLMSTIPEEVFLDAVKKTVINNGAWIPPTGKGALYLRPVLMGNGASLGVAPSPSYTLLVYASPVGNYFKGEVKAISLLVATQHHRSAPKGTGHVKASGNYAPVFEAQKRAKDNGFSEALFLDAKEDKYVEEAGASNFFIITKDNKLITPNLGNILPGVTRETVMILAKELGYQVSEEKLDIDRALEASEAFCTGTGASITPVGSISYNGKKVVFGDGQPGKVTMQLYNTLRDIQFEKTNDIRGWLYDPYQDS